MGVGPKKYAKKCEQGVGQNLRKILSKADFNQIDESLVVRISNQGLTYSKIDIYDSFHSFEYSDVPNNRATSFIRLIFRQNISIHMPYQELHGY